MQIVRKNLVLAFETESGDEFEMKVLKPKESLDAETIKLQMDAIVATGVIGKDSVVSAPASAHYDMRMIDTIELA